MIQLNVQNCRFSATKNGYHSPFASFLFLMINLEPQYLLGQTECWVHITFEQAS